MNSLVSSSRGATNVSGTQRPPNLPQCPCSSGSLVVTRDFCIGISGYFSWKRAPQIPTPVHFVASPLAEGERNKVRGLRAEEYHFEMFKGTYRSPSLTLPLSFKKSE